jgi:hypothetical protein
MYFWLFAFLAVVLVASLLVLIRRWALGNPPPAVHSGRRRTVKRPAFRAMPGRQPAPPRDLFREKLGDKVVQYMIDISRSVDDHFIQNRIDGIKSECERLNKLSLPEENKKIISTVLIWAKNFDSEKHISEMKLFRKSSQIVYDPQKRDFKLMFTREV